jgi:hypothetical protein
MAIGGSAALFCGGGLIKFTSLSLLFNSDKFYFSKMERLINVRIDLLIIKFTGDLKYIKKGWS